jgi:hypothetical protein
MKTTPTLFNVLGVAFALAIPAVVVAQQFAANQPLRSADLQALVARVAALEAGSGPSSQVLGRLLTADQVPITATSDGFILATPSGGGFGAVSVQAGINATNRMFRATEGDSLLIPVSAGDVANVTPVDLGTAEVTVRWYPLRRNGASPRCPACVP